jgi:hypothetical protein
LRALVYVAAVALVLQFTPKRLWSQLLAGNTAVAIVLAAILIAIAIVIAAPIG